MGGALVLVSAPLARADVKLLDAEGWQFFSNGRTGGFLAGGFGDGFPGNALAPGDTSVHNNVTAGSGIESSQVDSNNKLNVMRIRSGFLSSVLGFSVKRQLSENTTARAHIEMWALIESARQKAAVNYGDVRETYLKIDGPAGGLLVGRALALFSRGAISMDFLFQHGNGLGNQCGALDTIGPTCGHVGYGVIFAGFNSQITYNTPVFAGLQLTVGIFDPVARPGEYDRTPWPRVEGELTFDQNLGSAHNKLHAFVNGLYQTMEQNGRPAAPFPATVRPTNTSDGVGFGAWLDTPTIKLGAAGHLGYGLGLINTLENTPNVFDSNKTGRLITGFYAFGGVDIGALYLNAGYGITVVHKTPQDDIDAMTNRTSLIRSQQGISVGANYRVASSVIVALEYFRADHSWYLGETQGINFYDAGITMLW